MYQRTRTTTILRLSDGASIPPDLLNRDYRQYLEDVKNGAEVLEADLETEPQPTRDERIITAAAVRKERIAAKKAAVQASALPAATKAAMVDLLDGMADIVDGLVEAVNGAKS